MATFKQDDMQGGQTGAKSTPSAPVSCAQCEAMLADVLDGTLTAEEQAGFDLHLTTCSACAQMLADAKRGAAWLELLRTPRPEPPAALLERILAQTSHQNMPQSQSAATHALPFLGATSVEVGGTGGPGMATMLPFRARMTSALQRNAFRSNKLGHAILQPRLAMTAAMAFFSIGLTLNLTGVRLNEFRLSNLKPANVRRTFYQADAHLVRYYTNLRVVYELESRVRDLQRAGDGDSPTPAEPEAKPSDDQKTPDQKKAHPLPGPGTSRRLEQDSHNVRTLASLRYGWFAIHPNATAQEEELV